MSQKSSIKQSPQCVPWALTSDTLKVLSKRDAKAVLDAISNLELEPRPEAVKKLSGGDSLYRLRVGNYRIIYQIRDSEILVILLKVADRREAYARMLDEVKARLKSI